MAPKKSNAEAMRQSRARMRADPAKYQRYLEKEKERYKTKKAAGKIVDVAELPEPEQRRLRRKWKLEKRKQRDKKEEENLIPNTPPSTPPPGPSNGSPESHQKRAGRRKVKRLDRKAYRTIENQKKTIKRLTNKIRAQKRLLRRSSAPLINVNQNISDSPASKADRLLSHGTPEDVRKELKFSFALSNELKAKMEKSVKKRGEKNVIRNIVIGSVMRKYRMLNITRSKLSTTDRLIKSKNISSGNPLTSTRKIRNSNSTVPTMVKQFFLQDEISRPTAGKKETKTKFKNKQQRRYLCDTMKNLYTKFKAANLGVKVSYTSFTRWRPFYVLSPDVDDRNTVKCKLHENAELKAKKMHAQGILKSPNVTDIMASVACDTKKQDCMFARCQDCKSRVDNIYKDASMKAKEDQISWMEWVTVTENKQTRNGKQDTKVTKKIEKSDTMKNLCAAFEKELKPLMAHSFKIHHQSQTIHKLKQNLKENEVVLQVDFSENYCAKAATEIQSMHFGGNRSQFALHTCHATFVENGQQSSKCYCTISDDTRHNASAVWAHLSPVLQDLSVRKFDTIHFISDGPTSQYKNKFNFNMAAIIPFDKKFRCVRWNFLESSHGKGPADGVGAAVKNAADRLVAHGEDILTFDKFMEVLDGKINVTLYRVEGAEIDQMTEFLESLKPDAIKNTMEIRQLSIPSRGILSYRNLSCYCSESCECHDTKTVIFKSREQKQPEALPGTSGVAKNPAIVGIENKLTSQQQAKFEKRFQEGYDVVHEDLSLLNMEEQQEYVLWKAWRAAKFTTTIDNNSKDDSDESENEDHELDPDWQPCETSFYAVVFIQRKSKKVTYIGRPTQTVNFNPNDQEVEMTFLERKMVDGQYKFDWPRRRDVCSVSRHAIIKEIPFTGPPPYHLTKHQNAELELLTKSHIF